MPAPVLTSMGVLLGRVRALIDSLGQIVSGTATINALASSTTVNVGAAFDGKPAFAILVGSADLTLNTVRRVAWIGSGVLTITGNAVATSAVSVYWFVDGR